MVKEILQEGNPILKAANIAISNFKSKRLQQLILNLIDTMHDSQLIGIAAPQIGENYNVFVTELRETKFRTKDQTDVLRVYINPTIVSKSNDESIIYEGCGCVERVNSFGPVKRPRTITVSAFNQQGVEFKLTADGILGRVIQHEYDHLHGIEFVDKVPDKSTLLSQEAYIQNIKGSDAQLNASKITIKNFVMS